MCDLRRRARETEFLSRRRAFAVATTRCD